MLTENATSLPSGRTKGTLAPPAVGFLLIDSSRKPIYINSEAIRILTSRHILQRRSSLKPFSPRRFDPYCCMANDYLNPNSAQSLSQEKDAICAGPSVCNPIQPCCWKEKLLDNLMFPKWPSDTS